MARQVPCLGDADLGDRTLGEQLQGRDTQHSNSLRSGPPTRIGTLPAPGACRCSPITRCRDAKPANAACTPGDSARPKPLLGRAANHDANASGLDVPGALLRLFAATMVVVRAARQHHADTGHHQPSYRPFHCPSPCRRDTAGGI